MKKLNFGCGDRIADGWVNIDFYSQDKRVQCVNLLKGFPYPDNSFDVVYSSHVIEHLSPEQALYVLNQAHRILKPGGILRTVVPDLAETCQEYLSVLALPDDDEQKKKKYEWVVIELLDQMVRVRPGGEMGRSLQEIMNGSDKGLAEYVQSRLQNTPLGVQRAKVPFFERLQRISLAKIRTKCVYFYLSCVKQLVPKNIRPMVFVETSIGERHRWMYDAYGLRNLCEAAGFVNCRALAFNVSGIPGFNQDCLDCNPDGMSYKNNSIYLEAVKSTEEMPYCVNALMP